ncbi:MAG: 4-hydroxy-tetrahydrodipicolinate reductase [Flavobacteriales bacterium]|nr:4-hydroxy-tetrahydrodipicolinate reductase [Flavobacteriales bacterium]
MKIGLIGYGKMGREIQALAIEHGHSIESVIDSKSDWTEPELFSNLDVAIEFSTPEAAFDNIKGCLSKKIPIVVGTTGWYDNYDKIQSICKEQEGLLFHATNFSIGVNIMFAVNRYLSELMNPHKDYEVWIKETHHVHKKDAPSGTAITLADGIISNLDRKQDWSLKSSQGPESLWIQSFRLDEVPGTHEIMYNSDIDTISVKHEAKGRKGFALGAIKAAEWLVQQKTGIYGMKDLLNINV